MKKIDDNPGNGSYYIAIAGIILLLVALIGVPVFRIMVWGTAGPVPAKLAITGVVLTVLGIFSYCAQAMSLPKRP